MGSTGKAGATGSAGATGLAGSGGVSGAPGAAGSSGAVDGSTAQARDAGSDAEAGAPAQASCGPEGDNSALTEAADKKLPVIFVTVNLQQVINANAAATQGAADDVKITGRLRVVEQHNGTHTDLKGPDGSVVAPVTLDTLVGVSLHGTSSAFFNQKSLSVEFRDDKGANLPQPLLGMPTNEDWVLLSCANDRSCMRQALAHSIGRELGRWQPRTRFVEVFVGDAGKEAYQGIYLIAEPIRRAKCRVNIPKPAATPDVGEISGGYIVRKESGGKGFPTRTPAGSATWVPESWVSTVGSPVPAPEDGRKTVWSYHFPSASNITPEQKTYLQASMNSFEAGMKATPQQYRSLIDVPSFVDHALIRELANEVDSYSKSNYFVKMGTAAGGKLHMGPLWDFNVSFGLMMFKDCERTDVWAHDQRKKFGGTTSLWAPKPQASCSGGEAYAGVPPSATVRACYKVSYVPFWWEQLWADAAFQKDLRCRWDELRKDGGPLSHTRIKQKIDTWAAQLLPLAVPRHFKKWPDLVNSPTPIFNESPRSKNPDPLMMFKEEVTSFWGWLDKRLLWMDTNLPAASCAGWKFQ